MNIEKKRQREVDIVTFMIHLYYKKHQDLNHEYQGLLNYAVKRIEKCPMMEKKTFCSQCPIHCYDKKMQEKIKKVMKYSGPRMMLFHPLLTIKHALKI
ncbi:MAG: nitrous oxide-stimulated promoter family protein [Coprobacillus sp.]